MENMDIIKWKHVIIEWINCLKFTKPLQNVEDLKSGEFFKELLKFLNLNENLPAFDTITHITDFLKKYYPSYILENESAQIQDTVEITLAYSLLLHYCCMVDGREEFIAPLCKDLSYNSQISIKSFLEDLHSCNEITKDDLRNAIINTHKIVSTPTKSFTNTSFSSPQRPMNTPLMEYLKTPYKKQINYEIYKKEIKQLQAQLDLERFEKADLQEELNLQYEKNTKLDKSVADKQVEINKLRSELLSLESCTPPSDTKKEGGLENKRLRDEIISLEKYIEILSKEQEELQIERDKARDKLRKIEEQCNDWQGKAIQAERQTYKLSDENKNYLQELFYLRERCEELTTMLQELHPKKTCEESFESDVTNYESLHNKSGSIVDYESLASTVIDVQLTDAQKENECLKKQLIELELTSSELTSQLTKLQADFTKVVDDNNNLKDTNDALNAKVLLLIETQNELEQAQIKLKESSNNLLVATKLNDILNENITELNEKISSLEDTLSIAKADNNNLTSEIKQLIENNSENINKFNSQLDYVKLERDDAQKHLNEAIEKSLQFESENGILKVTFDKYNSDIDNCLIKFKEQLHESLFDNYPEESNTLSKLRYLVDALEMKNINDVKTLSSLQTNCHILSNKISDLEEEIAKLNLNDLKTQDEINVLKVCLQDSENKIEHYEKEVVTNYEFMIKKYKGIIDEKCAMITELSKLKDTLFEREGQFKLLENEKIELLTKVDALENYLCSEKENKNTLETNCTRMKNIISEKDSFIKALEMEKYNLQQNIDLLTKQIVNQFDNIQNLDKKLQQNREYISEKEQLIETLQNEKSSLNNNLQSAEKENEILKKHKDELETNVKELNDMISIKEDCIKELQNQNETMNKKIEELEENLEIKTEKFKQREHDLEINIKDLNDIISTKDDSIKELKIRSETMDKKLEDFVERLEKVTTNFKGQETEFKNNIQDLNDIVSKKDDFIKNLESQNETINKKLESETKRFKDRESELENNIKDLNDTASKQEECIHNLEIKNETIEKKLSYLEEEIKNMTMLNVEVELNFKNLQKEFSEKNSFIENLEYEISEINSQLIKVKNELINVEKSKNELETLYDQTKEILAEKIISIECLEQDKLNLNARIVESNMNVNKYEEELSNEKLLKDELNNEFIKSKQNYEDELKNLQTKFDSQILEIQDLLNNIDNLNENIETINSEILEISNLLNIKSDNKSTVVKSLKEYLSLIKEQIQITLLEKEECTEEIEFYKQKLDSYKTEYESFKTELETIIKDININFTLQKHLKNNKGSNVIDTENELQILKELQETHYQQQETGKEVLMEMCNAMKILKKKMNELVLENKRINTDTLTLQQQYTILDNLKTDIETKLDACILESNSKTQQIQLLEDEIEKYSSKLGSYHTKLIDSKKALTNTEVSIKELIKNNCNEIEKCKETIQDLELKNKKLQANEFKLMDEILDLQNKLKSSIDECTSTVTQQESNHHKHEREIVKLNKKLKKSTENYEQLQRNLAETTTKLDSSLIEIENYKTLNETINKTNEELKQENNKLTEKYESEIKSLLTEKDNLNEELSKLSKDLIKAKDKFKSEKTKNKTLSEQSKNEHSEFESRIKNFMTEIDKLEEKIQSLTNKLKSVETDREELEIKHNEFVKITELNIEDTKKCYQIEIENFGDEINNLQAILEQNKQEINSLEISKQELHTVLSDKEIYIEKLKSETLQLQENINALNEDKKLLSSKLNQLNEDFNTLKLCNEESNIKYEEKLSEIHDTKEKLAYTLNLIENISALLENELQKSTSKLNMAGDTLKENDLELKENLYVKLEHEIINLKTRIEVIVESKQNLEIDLQSISSKYSELEVKNSEISVTSENKYKQLIQQHNEEINNIRSENNEIIETLQNEIKIKEVNTEKYIQEISNLNSELIDKINEIEKVSNEKIILIKALKGIANDLRYLKEKRNEILETQSNISKEIEVTVLHTNNSVEKIKSDFEKRIEHLENERSNELELKKQLENYLEDEKNKVINLETRLSELTSAKENLTLLSSQYLSYIHELFSNISYDKNEEINKMKEHLEEVEDDMKSLSIEKEIVEKEYNVIIDELNNFKKLRNEMANYEIIKSDYSTLQNKYETLSECETENNTFKIKISKLENKLLDLQLENSKYQNVISEKQLEYDNIKQNLDEELTSMKSACNNWQKIIENKESETELLKQNHKTELDELKNSNNDLSKQVFELEQKINSNEETISILKSDYDILNQKYELVSEKLPLLDNEILNLQEKIIIYKNIVSELEHDNLTLNTNNTELKQQYKSAMEKISQDSDKVDKDEVMKLRASYSNLMADNSRLQLDCTVLQKTIEDRNTQLSNLSLIKEAYEKLLEDNNKVVTELDTIRYKRNRDKEEFKRLLEEEKSKGSNTAESQIKEMRHEYEEKLRKMKEKIVNLYKEEMDKEKKKVSNMQQEHIQSEEIIQSLKSQLWVTGNKYVDLKKENEKLREQLHSLKENIQIDDFRGSRESVGSLRERRAIREVEERRVSTLPRDSKCLSPMRQVDIIEESVTFSRKRRSVTGGISTNLDHGLKMEDEEGELFNNTYLSDLKAGRCIESGRESVSSRISELQYRNSLCPPHLKSSYPAETQFSSPRQFKDEDLKMGTVELDDSMSSSLLPGEKPRMKKDWGQTMYKKPGPPTPSKNGGRLSLQGNEVHPRDVLRDHNENKGQVLRTPSRIKSLFTRSGTVHRNDSENNSPSRGKRRSIFRR